MLLRPTATFLISWVLASLVIGQAAKPDTAADIEFIQGKAVAIIDGDQIRAKAGDGRVLTIRIHGIDAPEPDQSFGPNARKYLEGLVLGKDVSVVVHRLDSQGRYMGTVFHGGQDIGARLLENGIAWHYKRVSGEQAFDVRARYAKAELTAREAKTGLWSEPMPVPPWEFREEIVGETPAEAPPMPATKIAEPAKPPPSVAATQDQESNRKYMLGPRGGCYYLNAAGDKIYVKNKSLCPKP